MVLSQTESSGDQEAITAVTNMSVVMILRVPIIPMVLDKARLFLTAALTPIAAQCCCHIIPTPRDL